MRHNLVMGRRRGVSALALVILLIGSQLGAARPTSAQVPPQAVPGGRVVVAAEQDPFMLAPWLVCCTLHWGDVMVDNLLPDAYMQTPDLAFAPEVLAEEAEVTLDPFSVMYRIKPQAVWNDGVPVSARDFVFTWRSYVNPDNQVWDRTGYRSITAAEVLDEKSVKFTFRRPYPDYKRLFRDVFPRHVVKDRNFNRDWLRQTKISAGPFELKEYERGSHLTLVRNDTYWGQHLAYLDEIEFRFIFQVLHQIEALRNGEVDIISPLGFLHPRLAELHDFEGVEVQNRPSRIWEHIDMSFRDDRLKRGFIRRAIATAIDREAIVEQVIRPLHPGAQVLQNLLFGVEEAGYEPHFEAYAGNISAARAILEDHGCEEALDGVYKCGANRLAFTYETTRGNPLRRRLAELVRGQLEAAGMEVEVRRRDAGVLFGYPLVSARYELIQYAWIADDLVLDRDIWSCDGRQNFTRYCNEDVGALLTEALREMDDDRRNRLANMADEIMARDMVSLPLYQKPTFLAYSTAIHGLVDNPSRETFTWNLGDWWREVPP